MFKLNSCLAATAILLSACGEPASQNGNTVPARDAPVSAPSAVTEAPGGTENTDREEPVIGTARYLARKDISEKELGVPVYPGAERVTGGTWKLTNDRAEGAGSITSIRLRTSDDLASVAAFYRSRMQYDADQSFEFEGTGGRTISLTTDTEGRGSSNVVLRQEQDGTRIDITVMGTGSEKGS